MLPKALVSVYQEYKNDTNIVASWLVSTAKECGYPADKLENTSPPAPQQQPATGGRLKGKARTAAKKKNKGKGGGNAAASKPAAETRTKHIIAIKDFVPLAECISVSKNKALSVPDALSRSLTRVIAVRSAFSGMLSKYGAKTDAQSDSTHSYFVGILQKVQELLKPLMPGTPSKPTDDVEEMTNLFSILELYEPSEEFLNAPDAAKAPKDEVIYEAEPSDTLEEAIMAFWMLAKDLHEVRVAIIWQWSQLESFSTGHVRNTDPAVVAVVTNTGIDIGRSIIEEALPLFERHGGAFAVCEKFYELSLINCGQTTEDFDMWSKHGVNMDVYNTASFTCYFAGSILNKLAEVPIHGGCPVYPDDHFGVYNPQGAWESRPIDVRFRDDVIVLGELFWEAMMIAYHAPNYPIVDEFLRGIKEYKETKKMPFYLIFAAQVTLDIHHTVGSYAEASMDTLFSRLDLINDDYKTAMKYHGKIRCPSWTAANQKSLEESQRLLDQFIDDPVHAAKLLVMGRKERDYVNSIKKHRLLRRSPIIAGLALFYFRADMYETGIYFTNAWASLILPAHMYNAAKLEGMLEHTWHDMEFLFQELGRGQFLFGDDMSNYARRCLLQIGFSASHFTNKRRANKPLTASNAFSRAGTRFIKPGAAATRRFLDRYWRDAGPINWTAEGVLEVITSLPPQHAIHGILQDKCRKIKPGGAEPAANSKTGSTVGELYVDIDNLLRGLCFCMLMDMEEFSFPYLSLHHVNWNAMKLIKTSCHALLVERLGPNYIGHEWELPFVIAQIFCLTEEEEYDPFATACTVLDIWLRGVAKYGIRRMEKLCGPSILPEQTAAESEDEAEDEWEEEPADESEGENDDGDEGKE